MKRKLLVIGLPIAAGVLLMGIGIVSAAGFMGGPGSGFGGRFNTISPSEHATNQAAQFQAAANALGLSESVIIDGWSKGQSLEQIALANGISRSALESDLQKYHETQLTAYLQALVTNGTITQDQMNARLAFEAQRASQMRMHGGHGFRGPPSQTQGTTTTTQ